MTREVLMVSPRNMTQGEEERTKEWLVTLSRDLASSAPRQQSCTPRVARTAGRRSSRGRPAWDRGLPTRSTGRPRHARRSEEVLQGELLLRLLELDLLRLLFLKALMEQVRLDRPHEERLLVPPVHLGHVREGLR